MPPKKKLLSSNSQINKLEKNNDNIKQPLKQSLKTESKPIKKQVGGDDTDSEDSDDFLESDSEEVDDNFDETDSEEEEDDDDKSEDQESEEEENNDDGDDGDDDCLYKFVGNKKNKIQNDDDFEIDGDDIYFEEDEKLIQNIFVSNDKRITKPTLTKYERVRLLGERAKQISLGAKPMVKNVQDMKPKEIAQLELELGVIPMFVIRTLPTGQKERWRINELKIVN